MKVFPGFFHFPSALIPVPQNIRYRPELKKRDLFHQANVVKGRPFHTFNNRKLNSLKSGTFRRLNFIYGHSFYGGNSGPFQKMQVGVLQFALLKWIPVGFIQTEVKKALKPIFFTGTQVSNGFRTYNEGFSQIPR